MRQSRPITHFAVEAMMTLMAIVALVIGIATVAAVYVRVLALGG